MIREKSHIILQRIYVISYRSKANKSKQISQKDHSVVLSLIIFILLTRRIEKNEYRNFE